MVELVAVGAWVVALVGLVLVSGRALLLRRAERDRAEAASVAAGWTHWFTWQAEATLSGGRGDLGGHRHAA
jgi:hypothetical protein